MDAALDLLRRHEYHAGMDCLVKHLRDVRLASADEEWDSFVKLQVLAHPIRDYVLRDPFTRRSFEKPRGFPGDAVLLDFIYGFAETAPPPDPIAEPVAHGVYNYTVNAPAPRAVRYRRFLLARLVDHEAERFRAPRILSIACGHLREVQLSAAFHAGTIAEWCALDQDDEALGFVDRTFGSSACVRPIQASVRDIISGRFAVAGYHLVYATGLFDYLKEPHASALVERMFEATVPGGRVVVTNFLPAVHDVGYMESFMDWHLVFRKDTEVLALFSSIPRSSLRNIAISVDPEENIVFATAEKR